MKIITGIITSIKMNNTVVVEVTRRQPHPLYRKLLKVSKKFKVETEGKIVALGDNVRIVETRPIAKDKHFKLFVSEAKAKEAAKPEEIKKTIVTKRSVKSKEVTK